MPSLQQLRPRLNKICFQPVIIFIGRHLAVQESQIRRVNKMSMSNILEPYYRDENGL